MNIRNVTLLLFISLSTLLCAQKTSTTSVKMEYLHLPTLPVDGVNEVGVHAYTAGLPFTMDTLRLYLGNMDILKSGGERLSKMAYRAATETNITGNEGDITISMAFGAPLVGSKELLDGPCLIAKDGCKQYYYKVAYQLPALVQASKGGKVLETWKLDPAMTLQFGNEQVETYTSTGAGSTTSIRTISYSNKDALDKAYAARADAWFARKAAVVQLGRMAESMYPRLFFLQEKLNFDLTYGKGDAADYTDTEQAAEQAAAALVRGDYKALADPIATWIKWLERTDANDKKAAVSPNIAEGLHENMAIACAFAGDYTKAHTNLDKALEFAQQGMVNTNKVERLKRFHAFIDDLEQSRANNANANTSDLVEAPDIKKILGRRKFNESLNFISPENKYDAFAASMPVVTKVTAEMTLEEALAVMDAGGGTTSTDPKTYDDRLNNGMIILSSLFDPELKGGTLPESICGISGVTNLKAKNLALTSIPECIGQLTGLEKLVISGNAITELPANIANLTELKVLDISDNKLTTLPEGIYGLKNLKKLSVSGNDLSAEVLQTLAERLPDCKIN